MWLQVLHMHREAQAADTPQWAYHADAVVQMDHAQQGEGERLGRQHLQLQGEGHYVREGRRQASIVAEMAELAIGLELLRPNLQVTAQSAVGQSVASDLALARGAQVKAGKCRCAAQVLPVSSHVQAPITAWPQTRSTWPLTAPLPGWTSQAMASATSWGRPP
ncbi:hypothetical protein D9M71_608960 [compost metagenome]